MRKKSRPRPSSLSLKSKILSDYFKRDSGTPGLSGQSMHSDRSRDWLINFRDAASEDTGEESSPEPLRGDPDLTHIFMRLEKDIVAFVQEQLRRFHMRLASDYPECPGREEEGESTEAVLKITVDFLKRMDQELLAERLHSQSPRVCRDDLKGRLQQKYSHVSEGVAKEGDPALLTQIYTEVYLIEGGASGVNQEHEVRHLEAVSRKPAAPETSISCEEIFKVHKLGPIREERTERGGPIREERTERRGPIREERTERRGPIREERTERGGPIREERTERRGPIREERTERRGPIREERTERQGPITEERTERGGPIREESTERRGPIRTVLTKGVAGVGKTVLTQKFSLDWAEGRANQDIQLLFPFTFRELNVLKDRSFSLVQLIHHFFSQTKGLRSFEGLQLLFIFDGLDECRLPLDFTQTKALTDPTESASVEELLVNLIRGDLLPSARLWITTRPAAANQIPAECVSMVTEVRGFTDEQKEQYFMKRVSDERRATAVISHIKKSRSLFIMCHLPIFCWILLTVLLHVMKTGVQQLLPQTMTELYIHFLVVQAKVKNIKYHDASGADLHWTPETKEMVRCLGKLAFKQLQKGNLIFYESDLRESGLDPAEIARYSGVFTQVFREEPGLYQDKVYCFIHLSVQEFLAALHVHQTFYSSGQNLLPESEDEDMEESEFKESQRKFYDSAVVQAVESPNGHLDLFLRFLMGLSLPTNQRLLSGLLTPTGSSSLTNEEIAEVIKERLEDIDLNAESRMNLLHCLNELKAHSLMEQVQQIMREGRFSDKGWSPSQWSAVSFLVLSSDSDLKEFDIRKYSSSLEALQGLVPLIKASTKAILSGSELEFCDLSSVLSSSSLTHLDLSHCDLSDRNVTQLCDGLKSAPCRLQTLSLSGCFLPHGLCAALASALSSSSLKHLDLSNNDLQDSGVELLCEALKSAPCRLEVLRLSGCLVSERGGASLASALSSAHCCLTELDLSFNHPGSSTELLTAAQDDPHCPLEALRLDPAGERWMVPGPRKYRCEVLLDPNTANNRLELSEDLLSVANVEELQLFPSHEERFSSYSQVLSSTALSGRCYWEVKRSKDVDIAVSLRGIRRHSEESRFGDNDQSWSLRIRDDEGFVCHRKREIMVDPYRISDRVGVFLDSEAGALTFYGVFSGGKPFHLHSFSCSFTEPLFVGFGLRSSGSSVSLLDLTKDSTSLS